MMLVVRTQEPVVPHGRLDRASLCMEHEIESDRRKSQQPEGKICEVNLIGLNSLGRPVGFLFFSRRQQFGGLVNFILGKKAVRACCQLIPIRLAEPLQPKIIVPQPIGNRGQKCVRSQLEGYILAQTKIVKWSGDFEKQERTFFLSRF